MKEGLFLSDEEKKKKHYYYGGQEKKAGDIRKSDEITPYSQQFQSEFDRMMERFQREFEDFWASPAKLRRGLRSRAGFPMLPSVDLEDCGKDFHLTVDLPGFSKEDVDVQISTDFVAIRAEKTLSEDEKKKDYVRHERTSRTFYRRIQLPAEVKSDDAKASLNNGILEVVLPKKEPKETKKLKID
jgi:HSP20 family protein